jgi:trimethylamine:corrinoid methyltransferase-like protein
MHSTTPNNIAFPSKFTNRLLTDEQLLILKNGTLQLLDEVGVHFPSQRALEIFSDHALLCQRSAAKRI